LKKPIYYKLVDLAPFFAGLFWLKFVNLRKFDPTKEFVLEAGAVEIGL